MNVSELKTLVFDDLNFDSSPPASVVSRILRYLNEGHRHVLRRPNFELLRQRTVTFDTEADRKVYGLPQAFERIDAVRLAGNDRRLRYRTHDWLADTDPGERQSGTPSIYVDAGLQPVFLHPSSDGVWAVSTAAGDTTQTARMNAINADGDIEAEATATLTGTTRVQLGTSTDLVGITSPFTLSAVATGEVGFYDASTGGNLLARIPIGRTSVMYQGVQLWPTPAAIYTMYVDGQIRIPSLVNDQDEPLIPESFHDQLACYARYRYYKKEGDQLRLAVEQAELERWNEEMENYVEWPKDYRPRSGSVSEEARISNLGSWFPPDSSLLG